MDVDGERADEGTGVVEVSKVVEVDCGIDGAKTDVIEVQRCVVAGDPSPTAFVVSAIVLAGVDKDVLPP